MHSILLLGVWMNFVCCNWAVRTYQEQDDLAAVELENTICCSATAEVTRKAYYCPKIDRATFWTAGRLARCEQELLHHSSVSPVKEAELICLDGNNSAHLELRQPMYVS